MALVAGALALPGCTAPAPVRDAAGGSVQAYVSAALLVHWCSSSDAVDVEACLSYLRGHFDTLAVMQVGAPATVEVGTCIPATAAITELRAQVRERAPNTAADRALPAARMLAELWRARYPCPANPLRESAEPG